MSRQRLHPALVARRLRAGDVAYGSFLYLGVVFAVVFVVRRLPTDWLVYVAAADVLSLPITLATLVAAGIVGIASTLRLRREAPVIALALLTAAIPPALWAGPSHPGLVGPFFVAYTLLALALPLRWFLRRRRQLRREL